MVIDCNCTTVEQDGTRRYRKSGIVRWKEAYIRVYNIVQYAGIKCCPRYTFEENIQHVNDSTLL